MSVCCPICWAMPDQPCRGDGGTHLQRINLALRAAEPVTFWPAHLYREPPADKFVRHPEFARGRSDAIAGRRHVGKYNPTWKWSTVGGRAYGFGYGIGTWQRHEASGLPHLLITPGEGGGFGRELLMATADALALHDGDRERAGVESQYGPYLSEQYFSYVAKWLPLCPLQPPPPIPDRTRQLSLTHAIYQAEHA